MRVCTAMLPENLTTLCSDQVPEQKGPCLPGHSMPGTFHCFWIPEVALGSAVSSLTLANAPS